VVKAGGVKKNRGIMTPPKVIPKPTPNAEPRLLFIIILPSLSYPCIIQGEKEKKMKKL